MTRIFYAKLNREISDGVLLRLSPSVNVYQCLTGIYVLVQFWPILDTFQGIFFPIQGLGGSILREILKIAKNVCYIRILSPKKERFRGWWGKVGKVQWGGERKMGKVCIHDKLGNDQISYSMLKKWEDRHGGNMGKSAGGIMGKSGGGILGLVGVLRKIWESTHILPAKITNATFFVPIYFYFIQSSYESLASDTLFLFYKNQLFSVDARCS